MNIRATATFKAGSWSRLEAKLVPLLTVGAQNAAAAVLEISQALVPVDTGFLKSTGGTSVEWKGSRVTGFVAYSASYSAFVEYGVRQRGAAGEWAGPFAYSEGKGYAGFGYLRQSIDIGRQATVDAFRAALGV